MLTRRSVLSGIAAALTVAATGIRGLFAASRHEDFANEAERMRERAIADGDQPYGAVVVKDGRIVGFGPSRVVVETDPTAHAETTAIRDAARRLGTHDLSGCVMYTTSPPCRMCETAAFWARIGRVHTGPDAADRGAPQYGC